MSHKYLTMDDRNKIEVLNKEGYSARKIANILGFHHSTISRELKRCKAEYSAVDSQKYYQELSMKKGRKSK
ncbi:Helix-turn-helix domain-containing protein, partial [Anaerosphaera aminiphila DSM 21120]